ncbi:MAG: DUF3999 family protein [Chitinophagaceae bacterium]|nr:MAG: DUF3999 family protein [Chitinophagaceae bacterium]
MTALRNCLLLLVLSLPLWAAAQPRVRALLAPVEADGFYRIFVSPELSSWARADRSDLQLRDSAGAPVPYLPDTLTSFSSFSFINYPLLAVHHDSLRTGVELSVPEAGTESFFMQFAATAAQRPAALSGSNDRRTWYSIEDYIELKPEVRDQRGVAVQHFHFPYSRYRYLRLEIFNGKTAPLLPVVAGRISGGTAPAAWDVRQRYNFSQADSPGRSLVRVYNPRGVLVERLSIRVRKPLYFARNVTVSALRANRWEPIATQVLATGQTELLLPPVKDELLELSIENGANPPLQIDSIDGAQRRYFLVAHLEKGQSYYLYAGDPTAEPADYDLAAFRDRIPSSPPELGYRIEQLAQPEAPGGKSSRIWIWIALAAGIGLLVWLTLSLLRELKKKEVERP